MIVCIVYLHFNSLHPNLATPPSMPNTPQRVVVYGPEPPPKVDLNDICPPPVQCEKCSDPKEYRCKEGIYFLYDLLGRRELEVRPLLINSTYFRLPDRTLGKYFHSNTVK